MHENHRNAPDEGSFTTCVYANGVVFDRMLVRVATAVQPTETRLLIDAVGIPVQPAAFTLVDDERLHRL